jgi:hypothetical protein
MVGLLRSTGREERAKELEQAACTKLTAPAPTDVKHPRN